MNIINISNVHDSDLYRETGWQHQFCDSGILGFCVHQSRKDHVLPEQRGLQS